MAGTVYLLHFAERYHHAGHYIGWTSNGVDDRLAQHLAGYGSPLVAAVVDSGIDVVVARTWNGDRSLERQLKDLKATPRLLCPICRGEVDHADV